MKLEIHDFENEDPEHLAACIEHVRRWGTSPNHPPHEIYCRPRDADGWLEYALKLTYANGGHMWVGAIQRQPGAPVEFHS